METLAMAVTCREFGPLSGRESIVGPVRTQHILIFEGHSGQITGWTGLIRVDNATYVWMGAPSNMTTLVNQIAFEYTSTRSIFTMDVAGIVGMNVTFLSLVSPNDLLRASLPYSYLDIAVWSTDGNTHDVQVYSDISGEWTSAVRDSIIQWTYGSIQGIADKPLPVPPASPKSTTAPVPSSVLGTDLKIPAWTSPIAATTTGPPTESLKATATETVAKPYYSPLKHFNNVSCPENGVSYHQVFLQIQEEFTNDYFLSGNATSGDSQGDWGYWYYSTANTTQLSFQSGEDVVVRSNFAGAGLLPNSVDPNFRAINDSYPVFGFSIDYGNVSSTSQSSLIILSHHQQSCVQFESGAGTITDVPCMWTSYFDTDQDAVEFFYNDYSNAVTMADSLDDMISQDSMDVGGENYAAITALAVRQAFGALEFTNTPNTPYVFLEEISSDDNIQTVDVIFPFHPIAIYLNATILKWILDPLLINVEAGNWPYAWAPHDLGKIFPNATGYSGDNNGGAANQEPQPVEESGNMLIMALAYAQRLNDNAFLTQHYNTLKSWADYLIQNDTTLIPQNQISTDDFAGPAANQTNLAIKGIIGIGAMAKIANLTGNTADGANYTNIATSYIPQWIGFCNDTTANPPHTEFNYNNESSYSLLYNIFGDAELGLGLVPQSVYDMQSDFYPTVFNEYGVLLDTRPNDWSKVDWQMMCAAVASTYTLNMFTSAIAKWLDETTAYGPFPDLYNVFTGE